MLETYPLYKGKNKVSNIDSSQCQFKVFFKIYLFNFYHLKKIMNLKGNFIIYKKDESLDESFQILLNRNGGFLKMVPSNSPIQVRVRVYIIKAFIFNPPKGECNPYLSVQIGDKIQEGNYQNNSVDPFFGR